MKVCAVSRQNPIETRYRFLSAMTNPTVTSRLEDGRKVDAEINTEIRIILAKEQRATINRCQFRHAEA